MAQVLVADGNRDVRAFAGWALMEAGYTVLEADSGLAALTIMAAAAPPLVVLLAARLPDLDSVQVLRFARQALRAAPSRFGIVLMAPEAAMPAAPADPLLDGWLAGALVKPFDLDELMAAVRAAERRLRALQPGALARAGLVAPASHT